MVLDLGAIPLALLAGVLSILSPCVWPLVPIVMASAATAGGAGPWFLAAGLSLSFAVAGTFVTLVLLNLGLNPDALRTVAAVLLLAIGAVLLAKGLTERLSQGLSRLTAGLDPGAAGSARAAGQFGVGALLGLVWLPCVGPTLGAAIALASLGQDRAMAFVVMLAFGIGTAATLLAAGLLSGRVLARVRPHAFVGAERGKRLLGGLLVLLGVLVLSGLDRQLEALAIGLLPDWATSI